MHKLCSARGLLYVLVGVLFLVLWSMPGEAFSTYKMPKVEKFMQAAQGDTVVLLHGILRTHHHMNRLASALRKDDYIVLNLDYPSRKKNIEDIVEHVFREIEEKASPDKPIHLVGFSLGALIIRGLIKQYPELSYGRLVLLAPPNEGSEVADYWKDSLLFQKVFGPAGQQLVTDQEEFKHLLIDSLEDFEAGIIAGNRTVDPFSSGMLPGPNDGKVTIESTHLAGVQEHIVVSATHMFFPKNRTVIDNTRHFLATGKF